jgi:hypothetical protein
VDDTLGVAGGARGEEHRGHVLRAHRLDRLLEEVRVLALVGVPSGEQVIDRCQARLAVLAQAAQVVEPDVGELRALGADLQQLVHLLLVLDDSEAHLGVVEREDTLGAGGVLVQRDRDRTEALRCQHRHRQARAVVADHHDVLTALQARGGQTTGHAAHLCRQCRPAQGLPDPVFFFSQGWRVGSALCMVQQQARKGCRHHASPRVMASGPVRYALHRRIQFDVRLSV